MQTKDQVKEQFLSDLRALLAKYSTDQWKAEIEASDHFTGYPECGEDVRMVVLLPSVWENGEEVREMVEIDLGPRVTP